MNIHRKVDDILLKWKNRPGHKPLLVIGIRQSGKTYAVKKFARDNYKNVFYFDFMRNSDLKNVFQGSLNVDDLVTGLSLYDPSQRVIPGETVFIFDEIQECPRARLSLKSFAEDERYDVIATGSYLGIKGYAMGDGTPLPVGYEEILPLTTMDFEEFLWANGYKPETLKVFETSLMERKPIPEGINQLFHKLFRQYLCVGGFPEAVALFLEYHDLQRGLNKVKEITEDLKNDFERRIGKDGKPVFKPQEVSRIRNAFSLIPFFLAKENKRYVVSKIEGASNKEQRKSALDYLEDAGIIVRSYNLETLSNPLMMEKIDSQFKVFPTDIGLLVSLLEPNVSASILQGELGLAKGALYEGLVADSLYKAGVPLFYFSKNSSLEVDFVEDFDEIPSLLEVKSQNGNAKAAKIILSHPEHYGKTKRIKLTAGNIGYQNGILTVPYYLTFLLGRNQRVIQTEDLSYDAMKTAFPKKEK